VGTAGFTLLPPLAPVAANIAKPHRPKNPNTEDGHGNLYPTRELYRSGIRAAQDSPKRADTFKAMAKKSGVNVKDVYWTLGHYDIVAIVEASDNATATAVSLSLSKLGNVRTQTLPAFSAAEMQTIIVKMK